MRTKKVLSFKASPEFRESIDKATAEIATDYGHSLNASMLIRRALTLQLIAAGYIEPELVIDKTITRLISNICNNNNQIAVAINRLNKDEIYITPSFVFDYLFEVADFIEDVLELLELQSKEVALC